MSRFIVVVLSLAALCAVASAEKKEPLKLVALANFTGQWNVSFALTSTPDKNVFVPHNCSEKVLGKACNQPAMSPDNHDKIQIKITLKNQTTVDNFKTHLGQKPKTIVVKLCYSEVSSMDRPWRKAKPIIKKDNSCPIKVKAIPFQAGTFNNNTAVYEFHKKNDLAKAVWYVRVYTMCDDGTKDGIHCQYDGTKAKNGTKGNYFETNTIEQVTPHLMACMIALSCVGPVFYIGFFVVDSIRRKQK